MSEFLFPWLGKKPFPTDPLPTDRYNLRLTRGDWHPHYRLPVIKRAGGCCERCGKRTRRFEVHHLTYVRFGRELMEDLQALCGPCHHIADAERKKWTRRRYSGGGDNGETAWCEKVFGEDPCDWPDDAADQFAEWLERKEEREMDRVVYRWH